jgi:hypothetical protein
MYGPCGLPSGACCRLQAYFEMQHASASAALSAHACSSDTYACSPFPPFPRLPPSPPTAQEPKACSVVLRGASKDVLNEVERNLHDAMGVARNVCIGRPVELGGTLGCLGRIGL